MFDIGSLYLARDVDDAIRALQADENAMLISGGTDVLVQVREGRLAGRPLVSIHELKELSGVALTEDGELVIGAATTFHDIASDERVRACTPMLGYAVDQVGGPQTRNVGTIGGNVCNGVTSADSASSLKCFNATLELRGPEGTRFVSIHDFYTGPGKTVRRRDEVLLSVRVARKDYEGYSGCYIKYGKRAAMEIATLGCAALLKPSPDRKTLEDARLAFGVAAPTPIRCWETEKSVRGMALGEKLAQRMAEGALSEVSPRTSWRASREFRMQLVRELTVRAVRDALAGGQTMDKGR